jgi:hypothetical protein
MRWSSFVAAAAAIVCGGLLSIAFVDKSTADGCCSYRHHHYTRHEHYRYVRPVQIVRVPMCMPNDVNKPLACNPPVAPAYVYQHHHTRYLATEVRYEFVAPHYHPYTVKEVVIRPHHHHYAGAGCLLFVCSPAAGSDYDE